MKKSIPLKEGAVLVTKQMFGTDSTPFPAHSASEESVLVMQDGTCVIEFAAESFHLKTGDTFIVPAGLVHQITGTPDFSAVHIMPKNIRFKFTDF